MRGRALFFLFVLGAVGAAIACGIASADDPPILGPSKAIAPTSTITASPTTIEVGQTVTVSVSVHGNNLQAPNAIELVDGVDPAAFTVQSAQSDVGACTLTGSQLQCPLGTVNNGSVIGNTIVLLARAPGTFQITANINRGGTPQSLTITVLATTADAWLKVPAATPAPKVGGKARAGIWVVDGGPLPEHSATISLTLPPQVKLLAATAQGGTCDVKRLTCRLGAIATGGQELIVLTFAGAKPGKAHVLVRTTGDVTDPTAANNQAAIAINVPKPAK